MQKKGWIISGVTALVLILAAAAILMLKISQQGASNEKWSDYDDYGWA
jgi:flagellar basal body-associated protein FliL